MKRLRIWYLARFCNYPLYRVLYNNGEITRLLYRPEAKGLAETFNGQLIIHYHAAARFIPSLSLTETLIK